MPTRWRAFGRICSRSGSRGRRRPRSASRARLNADTIECDGVWSAPELTVTKLTARQGAWTPGWTVRNLDAAADLTAPANCTTNFDASWSWWTNLQPYRLVWTARLAQLESEQTERGFDFIAAVSGARRNWRVTNLSAQARRRPAGGAGLAERRHARICVHQRFALRPSRGRRVADGQDARTARGIFVDAAAVVAGRRLADSARVDKPPARLARRSAADDPVGRRTGFHQRHGARRKD